MFSNRRVVRLGGLVKMSSLSLFIALAACGSNGAKVAKPTKEAEPVVAAPSFAVANFSKPTTIDNKWLPLAPGTQLTYEGKVKEAEGSFARRIVFTVTDVTKVINGLRTAVMWERDFNDDVMAESEITFYAQDDGGAVWLLGEYPEVYEGTKFTGAPSTWIAGLAGAKAGILMPAEPTTAGPVYLQGLAPDVEFYDVAKIHQVGQQTCVPAACYKDVMVVDEWDPSAQPEDGHQLKYHAPGVGNIRVEAKGGDAQEVLELTKFEQVSPEVLAQARQEALRLDQRAYDVIPKYKETLRAE